VHAFTAKEAAGHRLTRFEGATMPLGKLLGLTKRGRERGELPTRSREHTVLGGRSRAARVPRPQDAGVERWFHRPVLALHQEEADTPGSPVR